jgi:hypothetical protein
MEYFKASWIHDLKDQPILFYSELDNDRYEVRKIEIYKDDSFGFADTSFEFGGAALGTVSVPSIEEINSDPQFLANVITKEEFEEIWTAYNNFRKESYPPQKKMHHPSEWCKNEVLTFETCSKETASYFKLLFVRISKAFLDSLGAPSAIFFAC